MNLKENWICDINYGYSTAATDTTHKTTGMYQATKNKEFSVAYYDDCYYYYGNT